MRKVNFIVSLSVVLLLVFFASCEEESIDQEQAPEGVPEEVIEKLLSIGINTGHGVRSVDVELPNGVVQPSWAVLDYRVPKDQLFKRKSIFEKSGKQEGRLELYRSYHTVQKWKEYQVTIQPHLPAKMKSAIWDALNAYNGLGLSITFKGHEDYTERDMNFWLDENSAPNVWGYVNNLPYDSKPTRWIALTGALNNKHGSDHTFMRFVAMHEIGHAIGLYHSDQTAPVCGGSGYTPPSWNFVHIPGTDSGNNANSIMKTCSDSNNITWFTGQDKTGLNAMYGK